MNTKNNNIEVVPFSRTFLKDELLTAIKELGFKKPTPIQKKVIPHLLSSNQDLIASAQTGTGKTAAFGLPLLNLTQVEDLRTQTIILCPTRELCIQITNDLKKYSKYITAFVLLKQSKNQKALSANSFNYLTRLRYTA